MGKLCSFLVPAMIACLVFTTSCVSKDVEVIETYLETEYSKEPYTVLEQIGVKIPNSTPLMEVNIEPVIYNNRTWSNNFALLFNKDRNGTIFFAPVDIWLISQAKSFGPPKGEHNHRISVNVIDMRCKPQTVYDGVIALLSGRDPKAIEGGFKPLEPTTSRISSIPAGIDQDFLKRSYLKRFTMMYPSYRLETAGYGHMASTSRVSRIVEPVPYLAEFPFEEMFQRDGWALIEISIGRDCSLLTASINYVYDRIETSMREVTKYREVPYQVEKQRTITKTEKIPFWEAILSK